MAKVKFNVKGVTVQRGGGEPVPKGLYDCSVETCVVNQPEGKDRRIEVVYTVDDGDHKGRKFFDYVNLESEQPFAQSRQREFLEAFGIVTAKKEAGEFDPDEIVGEKCKVLVGIEPAKDGYDAKNKVRSVLPAEDSEEDEDLDDEDGDDDDEEPDDDEDDEDSVELDELDRTELKRFIKDQELSIVVKKSMSDNDVRTAITEAMGDGDDPDYQSMDLDELRATCKERGLKTTGSKKLLITRLEKSDEESDDEEPF